MIIIKCSQKIFPTSEMATVVGFCSPPAALLRRRRRFSFSTSQASPTSHRAVRVRCSVADEAGAGVAVDGDAASVSTSPSSDESPAVGTQKRSPSLISAANVQKALRGVAITNADHYGRLGIRRGTSYDQVKVAYERKCEELMNKGLNEEETNKELELLKESYMILSSEDERRLYDWSLARSDQPDRYVWPFEIDITQTPTQLPPPQTEGQPRDLIGCIMDGRKKTATT